MWYNFLSSSEIVEGAPDIKSRPSVDFGKAITSLILDAPQMIEMYRSRPYFRKVGLTHLL